MIVINGTKELIEEYYGEVPRETIKTVVAVDDGKPLAVAGVRSVPQGMVMFSDMSEEFKQRKDYKKTLIKGYRKLFKSLPDVKIYSHADPEIEGSDVLLKHLGFVPVGDLWLF